EAVAGDLRQDARWIFHIGHVGSTLLSRLLGELDRVLAIREPRLLRDLALSPPEVRERYVQPMPKLMSRTFAADEIACVKATSFAAWKPSWRGLPNSLASARMPIGYARSRPDR